MLDYENSAPVQCRQCGEIAAFPAEDGYCCEACGHTLSWSFFKMWKMKCGCERCQEDLQQEFWKNIPPHQIGNDYSDFQI